MAVFVYLFDPGLFLLNFLCRFCLFLLFVLLRSLFLLFLLNLILFFSNQLHLEVFEVKPKFFFFILFLFRLNWWQSNRMLSVFLFHLVLIFLKEKLYFFLLLPFPLHQHTNKVYFQVK